MKGGSIVGEKERNEEEQMKPETTTNVDEEVKVDAAEETAEETMEATDATEADEVAEEGLDKKKGFFKKEKKKDKKDEQIEELNDRVMRQMAEFDNFRKRSEKEKSQMFEMGAKDIIEKILPVIDNFERGLSAISEEEREGAFAKGIEAIYKQLLTTLEDVGVTVIEAVGAEFDPNLHNAVMHVEDESAGENIIVEEFQRGYKYRETVVRHSMVKVAN